MDSIKEGWDQDFTITTIERFSPGQYYDKFPIQPPRLGFTGNLVVETIRYIIIRGSSGQREEFVKSQRSWWD